MSKDYSFLAWIRFVYNTDDKQVFSLCNAEGFLYLYFLRSAGIFFLILSVSSIVVMIPLFIVKFENVERQLLQKLTIENAYDSSAKLYVVLLFSFIYTFMAYFFVYNFKRKLISIQGKVQSEDSYDAEISRHTLHIRGINANLSYIDAKKLMQSYFDISYAGRVAEIHVIPHYDVLMDLIERKSTFESKLNKYKKQNENFGGKRETETVLNIFRCKKDVVDGEIYYSNWVRIIDNLLDFYRKLNSKSNTGNAFVSFKTPSIVQEIIDDKNLIYNKADSFHGELLGIKVIIAVTLRTGVFQSHHLLQI
jgi:hypothetical protein